MGIELEIKKLQVQVQLLINKGAFSLEEWLLGEIAGSGKEIYYVAMDEHGFWAGYDYVTLDQIGRHWDLDIGECPFPVDIEWRESIMEVSQLENKAGLGWI